MTAEVMIKSGWARTASSNGSQVGRTEKVTIPYGSCIPFETATCQDAAES
jgi:hypothetical protein